MRGGKSEFLGGDGYELVDQWTGVVGGVQCGGFDVKGIIKKLLLHVILVTSQVAASRRVYR